MRRYTAQDHGEYRQKVDEQAKKEEEANQERTEEESARRAWLADGGREAEVSLLLLEGLLAQQERISDLEAALEKQGAKRR